MRIVSCLIYERFLFLCLEFNRLWVVSHFCNQIILLRCFCLSLLLLNRLLNNNFWLLLLNLIQLVSIIFLMLILLFSYNYLSQWSITCRSCLVVLQLLHAKTHNVLHFIEDFHIDIFVAFCGVYFAKYTFFTDMFATLDLVKFSWHTTFANVCLFMAACLCVLSCFFNFLLLVLMLWLWFRIFRLSR